MSEQDNISEQLLEFFKALADANRLKIVGLLAQKDFSVEQMAEILGIGSSTVSHHLSRLSKAGLVSAHAESYYNVYTLNVERLESLSKELLAKNKLPSITENVDMDAYDQKVIKNYSNPDGTLKLIPTQQKKLSAILFFVAKNFEYGKKYSEKEVNQVLEKFHPDYAFLRRSLIDFKIMDREASGGSYWLLDQL